nr:3848_t:CDS:2 [Entrophospora candida]
MYDSSYAANHFSTYIDSIQTQYIGRNAMEKDMSWKVFKADFDAFINAVDWKQPLLIGIFTFHILTLYLLIIFRNNANSLSILTFGLLFLTGFASKFNDIANKYWESFSTDNYFDKSGFFITMVFSFPALINATIGVVSCKNN